jgi:hypothetical protein
VSILPGSVARSREKAHLLQEVSRGFDSLSIRVVQPVDIEPVEIAEYTMHLVALFELLLHRKRLTARRRGKTLSSGLASGFEEVTALTNKARGNAQAVG